MKRVYVFLANGFEEVEAVTPIDYLRRCEELEVLTVGVEGKVIEGSHGISMVSDISLFDLDMESCSMLVLPGGMPGTLNLSKSKMVLEAIEKAVKMGIYVAAICAAPSILGQHGYLRGKKATCAEGFQDELIGATYTGEPVEVSDKIITARGAGVANQFAFALVEALTSEKRLEKLKGAVRWAE